MSDVVGTVSLDDLLEIQHVCLRNNARQNITGILLHCEGHFFQCLEGEQKDLRHYFDLISKDQRHTNVKLLKESLADRRYFGQWHMAMLDLNLHSEAKRADFWALIEAASDGDVDFDGQPKDLLILDRFAELLSSD